MEKLEMEAKKLKLLSDEELLNVCGGAANININLNVNLTPTQTLTEARKSLCTRAGTNKERCLQYPEYCQWSIDRCKIKGEL